MCKFPMLMEVLRCFPRIEHTEFFTRGKYRKGAWFEQRYLYGQTSEPTMEVRGL